ncbi:MarR family winged helix-turn-helix transcriptional regulator [Paractinoplanes rishiriensis]|uniref:MarR family transcriptional regulator n=1 Tax=Paractinoplanes rishiriensis TaxID=1050105 RepID=A0A919N217_9ACTN|nr:MarR family transcriptional regulator [Actinoplanes rishiriensis]GIE98377.1 MarR family transcriptional regulator [Actinoplanes rishiriensis]
MTDATSLRPEQLAAYLTLKEVAGLLEHAVEKQLRDAGGLTVPQFTILARLHAAPGHALRMTDLADGLVYSRSGLTYQAAQLEKAGLVTRTPGAEDERSVTVTLTAAGQAALEQVMPGHVDVVQSLLFDVLTSEDVAAVGEILGRVRDRMRAAPPRSAAPRPHRRSPRT